MKQVNFSGMKITVMGLGLHGGGLESARYLLRHGAEITVTDLQDKKTLAPSIERLDAEVSGGKAGSRPIRYVLGRHETADFEKADMVVKNPGVKPDSPYLKAAKRIETDISLFLAASPARLSAVTGSKGKSSTASALHWALARAGSAYLGGNITVSPLTFLDDLSAGDDVVLELSSWQLGDLRDRVREDTGSPLLKPRAAVLTAILPDHLDHYRTMDAYVADKRIIYQGQDKTDVTIAADDTWGQSFLAETGGRRLVYSDAPLPDGVSGAWLTGRDSPGFADLTGEIVEVVPARLLVPGVHQKKNLLAAALVLLDLGFTPSFIRESLGAFPGIEHRLEFFHEAGGVRFYNDTAATIPEAAAAALESFGKETSIVFVTGGADKKLDFSPLVNSLARLGAHIRELILLAGTGSEKLGSLLAAADIPYKGPYDTVDAAVQMSLRSARSGDTILFSPGCASFGMFRNEFDRGRRWKEAVLKTSGGKPV
jgi:UDP-N-acetylmuramoylalanine--D-glutamate ligase